MDYVRKNKAICRGRFAPENLSNGTGTENCNLQPVIASKICLESTAIGWRPLPREIVIVENYTSGLPARFNS